MQAEDLALAFLLEQGLRLRTRNYTCRLGEIDLVLEEGNTVVFVEVRQRRSQNFGGAAESITVRKRQVADDRASLSPVSALFPPVASMPCSWTERERCNGYAMPSANDRRVRD
jgi:hypothetical protein